MKMVLTVMILSVVLVLIGSVLAYVRFAPSAPARWHVDPLIAASPTTPNYILVLPDTGKTPAPVFVGKASDLAQVFDDFALHQPATRRLAGGPDSLMTTYIQRSKLMGYPDYLTIKIINLGQGRATLAIFSRSRFGISDGGVNKRRTVRWLTAFDRFEQVTPTPNQDN